MTEFNSVNNNNLNNKINTYNSSKYSLLLCELWHPLIHGYDPVSSDPEISGHYLLSIRINPKTIINKNDVDNGNDSDSDNDTEEYQFVTNYNDMKEIIKNYCINTRRHLLNSKKRNEDISHPKIRSYFDIVTNRTPYMKPEIGQILYLSGDEAVCIIKTFWLRLIQRKWKSIIKERKEIIKKRMMPNSILEWQKTGKWDNTCSYIPTLRGMLNDLQKM